MKYNEWLIEHILTKCNKLLMEVGEESIPVLAIKANLDNLPGKLLKHYKKEAQIQSRFGGIRNPAAILVNKIRHEFTNYDSVRDALTDVRNSGNIDDCRYYEVLSKIIEEVGLIVLVLINKIKCPINVNVCNVEKSALQNANDNHIKKELSSLSVERKLSSC